MSVSSSWSSSFFEDGNGARRGGDFERPHLIRRRANNEIWPGPFVEDHVVQVAIDASRSPGHLDAAAALAKWVRFVPHGMFSLALIHCGTISQASYGVWPTSCRLCGVRNTCTIVRRLDYHNKKKHRRGREARPGKGSAYFFAPKKQKTQKTIQILLLWPHFVLLQEANLTRNSKKGGLHWEADEPETKKGPKPRP